MAAAGRSTSSAFFALVWSIIGSALIGGTALVVVLILDGTAFGSARPVVAADRPVKYP